ncbi:MAG TPA: hypothetical protein VKV04_13855 [Verrucomicrobiae bacterium]|nr:hypothetical protein [Verrucomicrobiae bacterium]
MKKCSYCGKEYSDEATLCSIDEQPLESPEGQERTGISRRTVIIWSVVIGLGLLCWFYWGYLLSILKDT